MFKQLTTRGHCFLQQRKKKEHRTDISHFHNKMYNYPRITLMCGHLVELSELLFLVCKLNKINHLLSQ
jgi:hypothetical protein